MQVWSFTPDVSYLLGRFGEEKVLYYCVDNHASFTGYDRRQVLSDEEELCRRADLVVTSSAALQEAKCRFNPHTVLVPHGVDYEHFSKAVSNHLPTPADIADIPHPRLGFFGLIRDWVDLDLLADVARRRPDWHLVLIGDSTIELAPYQGLANMHFLGRKPYADLPAYCKEFDAGLVPFKINELTKAVNPIKLREYLAAGLPVVSTPLPEVKACGPWVRIAADAEEFVGAVEAELCPLGWNIHRATARRTTPRDRAKPRRSARGDARRDLAREGGSDLAGLVRKRVGVRSPSLRRETLETPCGKLLKQARKTLKATGFRGTLWLAKTRSEGRLGGSAPRDLGIGVDLGEGDGHPQSGVSLLSCLRL